MEAKIGQTYLMPSAADGRMMLTLSSPSEPAYLELILLGPNRSTACAKLDRDEVFDFDQVLGLGVAKGPQKSLTIQTEDVTLHLRRANMGEPYRDGFSLSIENGEYEGISSWFDDYDARDIREAIKARLDVENEPDSATFEPS